MYGQKNIKKILFTILEHARLSALFVPTIMVPDQLRRA
jgi:hypothetical protein